METKKRLVIADIDGTLVNRDKELMPLTKQALIDLHKQGVYLGIASGRPVGDHLKSRAEEWGLGFQFDVIIGMNGGQLLDTQNNTYQEFYKLDKEVIHEILDMMRPLNLNPFVYKEGHMLCVRMDEQTAQSAIRNREPAIPVKDESEMWSEDNAKVLFRMPDESRTPEVLAYAKAHSKPYYQSFMTGPIMIEFQDPRVNKGVALKEYCKNNGIDLKDVIAFGDATNDNAMLEVSGLGVCMKNGGADTKALADVITEYDFTEDGVGKYLFEFILG